MEELMGTVGSRLYRAELDKVDLQKQLDEWTQVAVELKQVVQQQQAAIESGANGARAQEKGTPPLSSRSRERAAHPAEARSSPLKSWNSPGRTRADTAASSPASAPRSARSRRSVEGGDAASSGLENALATVTARFEKSADARAEEVRALELELASARAALQEDRGEAADLRRALTDAEADAARAEARERAVEGKLAEAESRVLGERAQREELEARLGEEAALSSALRGDLASRSARVVRLETDAAALRERRDELERLARDLEARAEANAAATRDAEAARTRLGAELAAAVQATAAERRRASELQAALELERQRLEQARREAAAAVEAARLADRAATEAGEELDEAREAAQRAHRQAARHASEAAAALSELQALRPVKEAAEAALHAAREAAQRAQHELRHERERAAALDERQRAVEAAEEAAARRQALLEAPLDADTEVAALQEVLDSVSAAAQETALELQRVRDERDELAARLQRGAEEDEGASGRRQRGATQGGATTTEELHALFGDDDAVSGGMRGAAPPSAPAPPAGPTQEDFDRLQSLQAAELDRQADLAEALQAELDAANRRGEDLERALVESQRLASERAQALRAREQDSSRLQGLLEEQRARSAAELERLRDELEASRREAQALTAQLAAANASLSVSTSRGALVASDHAAAVAPLSSPAGQSSESSGAGSPPVKRSRLRGSASEDEDDLARAPPRAPPPATLTEATERLALAFAALDDERRRRQRRLDRLSAQHEEETAALRLEHEQQLQAVELAYLEELEEARGGKVGTPVLQSLRASSGLALGQLGRAQDAAAPRDGQREAELEALRREHARELEAQRREHARELTRVEARHEEELAGLRARYEGQAAELRAEASALRAQLATSAAAERPRRRGAAAGPSATPSPARGGGAAARTPGSAARTPDSAVLSGALRRSTSSASSGAGSPARCRITAGSQAKQPTGATRRSLGGELAGLGAAREPDAGEAGSSLAPVERELARLHAEMETCAEECERRGVALAECQDMVDELQAFAEQKKHEAEGVREQLAAAHREQRDLAARLHAGEGLLAEAQAAAAAARSSADRSELRTRALTEELASLRQMHDALQSEHTSACGQLAAAQSGHDTALRQIAELASKLSRAEAEAAAAAAAAQEAERRLQALEASAAEAPRERADAGDAQTPRAAALDADQAADQAAAGRQGPPLFIPAHMGTPEIVPFADDAGTPHSAVSQETSWSDTAAELAPHRLQSKKKSKGALHKLAKMLRGGRSKGSAAKETAQDRSWTAQGGERPQLDAADAPLRAPSAPTLSAQGAHRLAQARPSGFLGPQVVKWERDALRQSQELARADPEEAALLAAFTIQGGDAPGAQGAGGRRPLSQTWSDATSEEEASRARLSTLHEAEDEGEEAGDGEAWGAVGAEVSWHRNAAVTGDVPASPDISPGERDPGVERRTPLRSLGSALERDGPAARQLGAAAAYYEDEVSTSVLQGSPPAPRSASRPAARPPAPVRPPPEAAFDDEAELSARVRAWQLRKSAVWNDDEEAVDRASEAGWRLATAGAPDEPATPRHQMQLNSLHGNALFQDAGR